MPSRPPERTVSADATTNGTHAFVSFVGRIPTCRMTSNAAERVGSVQC